MTLNKNHPARSHAFLSRLHDGELEPSERAHFEAHRAHCKECRDAAADFERALSLFRSSRSSPPPKDLANRVLRKLQAHSSSRRTPFGDLFSVDLRWAGAFAAALLVLLVATPIILQQKKQQITPAEGPIPVALESRSGPPTDKLARADAHPSKPAAPDVPGARNEQGRFRALQSAEADPKRAEAKPVTGYASAPPEDAKREEKLSTGEVAAVRPGVLEKAQAPASAPAPASSDVRAAPLSNANRQVAAAPAPPAAAAPEAQGGEGARDQVLVSGDGPTLDRPSRLIVQPLDALGRAPELETRSQTPSLNHLRGRSFVVLVDGQGRVIDAQESASKSSAANEPKRRDAALAKEKDAAASAYTALKTLRFKAGERQRRLLVRVE
jgi:hypothetical protein